jgi:hypothetical protein
VHNNDGKSFQDLQLKIEIRNILGNKGIGKSNDRGIKLLGDEEPPTKIIDFIINVIFINF